jgi:hypothetical protein
VKQFANFSQNIYWRKIVELLRGKYCGENSVENFGGGKLFFNGQFTKIQAIKSSLQHQFSLIAGLALAILCFVENNLVSTILVFKRNLVDLFGQSSQQQQAKAGER